MATLQERHPHAYVAANQDPRTRKRTVPMEVLSCNISRTGTMSMKAAFEILGLPTWHHVEMSANPPDMDMWSDAFILKYDPALATRKGLKPFGRKEWDNLLGYWSATTDQPAACFTEELVAAYPEAKVILVERDVDAWFKSYCEGVIDNVYNPWIPLASYLDSHYMARICRQTDLFSTHYFGVTIPRATGLFNNPDSKAMYIANAKKVYIEHMEMVKRVTPEERLLVFRIEEGWKPLCEFLGKPVSDVPFPRVNETAAVKEKVQVYIANSYRRAATRMVVRVLPVLLVVAGVLAWRWKGR
ncbi:hypothetical protein M409DRAFT_65480 [Zasmidium cellare ATCC 36951]|uniref:P-loop containing nucleoside triphosphate hydrolase protein n=1 Tax=Zasmidium cellare ATCC 36951 TaxID=1080233 RepID=A0A6A6CN32_ZASCE|nr:uncharacterized protein M409DRAFT_65480 [Zasmidium cellare ATCC 36951]KAF2168545.1 hypothetical protein M409DRAFT_65480 [Zasmidium cellare ATCC 36951]